MKKAGFFLFYRKRVSVIFLSAALFLLSHFFVSCSSRVIFDDVSSIGTEGWHMHDKQRFEINVDDTLSTFRFFVHVRNDISYRYSNLYFFMQTRFPNGNVTRDTIECVLADLSGKWTGKGSGQHRDHLILLNQSLKFPLSGTYIIDIEQAMREDVLHGIRDVGIRIEKNPN
ncbi:MAG: gliding motility lipoprotein GldH [Bacteroidales bacterium]|nr:gliding motility lipoprotein GldH [Bacteroidales bacterium]